jgi:hypothetical protein
MYLLKARLNLRFLQVKYGMITDASHMQYNDYWPKAKIKSFRAGIWTRVCWVKASYPNQLDYAEVLVSSHTIKAAHINKGV